MMWVVYLILLFLQNATLPEGPGKKEILKACGTCHSPEAILNNFNSKSGWADLVDEMISKGAAANPRERKRIVAYLAKHFPLRPN